MDSFIMANLISLTLLQTRETVLISGTSLNHLSGGVVSVKVTLVQITC